MISEIGVFSSHYWLHRLMGFIWADLYIHIHTWITLTPEHSLYSLPPIPYSIRGEEMSKSIIFRMFYNLYLSYCFFMFNSGYTFFVGMIFALSFLLSTSHQEILASLGLIIDSVNSDYTTKVAASIFFILLAFYSLLSF